MQNKIVAKPLIVALIALVCFMALLWGLYKYDNKYTNPQPMGSQGVFSFAEKDLAKPLFLIDGWQLTVDGRPIGETFIGQYSNYAYVGECTSPFGEAEYKLTLNYTGEPRTLTLALPEIFTEYVLYVDGKLVAETGSGTEASFMVGQSTKLVLQTANYSHYYSGLVYPPALGTTETMGKMQFGQTLVYSIFVVSALSLTLFSLVLCFAKKREPLFLHFAILCLAFSLHCLHPFVWQFGLSSSLWYALEDASWFLLLAEAGAMATIIAGLGGQKWYKKFVYPLQLSFVLLLLCCVLFIIPAAGSAVNKYGFAVDCGKVLYWLYFAFCAGWGCVKIVTNANSFILAGCCILGVSLFANLLDNNLFEPIYTAWQSQWAGFLLVLVFAGLMVWRNHAILAENQRLTQHLAEEVEARTAELSAVLTERKSFFSDMAHNLKAPIAAIHGFVSLIREGDVQVDDELLGYITLIEKENLDMRRRVQSLNTLNEYDRINEPMEEIDLNQLLSEIYHGNQPEAEAMGIHFEVKFLANSGIVFVQRQKFLTLFENLIYNALAFTPMEGRLTIVPKVEENEVAISVADTGKGIDPQALPHIFERFYTARANKNEGSGLGLYIAKLTVEEFGGSICVKSQLGQGTDFVIRLPLKDI